MRFRLATRADDAQLRGLMRRTVVPGHISMAYTREPDFFGAYDCMGEDAQVIVAEAGDRIVGVGCRSVRRSIVNGEAASLGYLSGLRLDPSVRKSAALARGYAFLEELHRDGMAPAYLTTIIEGNEEARAILTSGRASLPSYMPMGRYLTHVIPVRQRYAAPPSNRGIEITSAADVCGDQLRLFLAEHGRRRQFFPDYHSAGLTEGVPRAIGRDAALVARRDNKIVGTMSLWDQGRYKQNVVAAYSGLLGAGRPLLNLVLRAGRRAPLPNVGGQITCGVAAMTCIADDDRRVFRLLLRHVLALASQQNLQQIAVGLHERDPLTPAMRGVLHVPYPSSLYLVSWGGEPYAPDIDATCAPYLELGAL